MADFDNVTPKKIGNFNVPKNVIECKIDTLAFLEILLRKNICTWEEVEEIRETVVMHMNVMFPELQLSYSTPAPLKDQAPITPPEQPQKPLYYNAPPPELETVNSTAAAPVQEAPKQPEVKPMMANAGPPKIMNAAPRPNIQPMKTPGQPVSPIKPINSEPKSEGEANQSAPASSASPTPAARPPIQPAPGAPRPMMPNAGPPKIMNNPPRKNI